MQVQSFEARANQIYDLLVARGAPEGKRRGFALYVLSPGEQSLNGWVIGGRLGNATYCVVSGKGVINPDPEDFTEEHQELIQELNQALQNFL